MNENELMHYGVLGMKWGVRKDPSKTYAKVTRKLNKLQDEYTYGNAFQRWKASRKSEKLRGAMYTTFAKIKSSDIDDESIRIGKKYVNYLLGLDEDPRFSYDSKRGKFKYAPPDMRNKTNKQQSKPESKYKSRAEVEKVYEDKWNRAAKNGASDLDLELIELERMEELDKFE